LIRLSEFIAAHMGLNFPRKRWRDLERGVISAARELGFNEPESFVRRIVSSPISREQIEALASRLTVGETYFLRERGGLDALREEIMPELLRRRNGEERFLRIWSAGCSSGEEPFSIAIILKEMGTVLREWSISILATDINPDALRKAAEGVFGEWSFRNTPSGFKEKYFRKIGPGRFEILPEIRRMVDFSYLNLAEDSYPSLTGSTNAMDLIFCRNVLMYFTPDLAKNVVERLNRSLVEGGWLIVSPCETSNILFSEFKAVNFTDATLYRKEGAGRDDRLPGKPPRYFAGATLDMRRPPCRPIPVTTPLKADPQQLPGDRLSTPPTPRSPITPLRRPEPFEEASRLYEQGQYAKAEERLSAFLPATEQDAMSAMMLFCRIRANQGKLVEARKILEEAISSHKLESGLHYLLAMILQEEGLLDKAAESLRRAIYLDQDLVLAHFSLANLALRQGKGNEARKHFGNTLALLRRYGQDDIIPGSDGMSAGRLLEIIGTMGMMEARDEERRIHTR
jgi:chemotaxis protein methyltransferase CheR